ncbi:hypothetical protein [Armatimonas sp.]|uniref:hypothetical protein n=1 Tax=Armatimonas sp. TaxID=1872638 RepID=UPI00374CB276
MSFDLGKDVSYNPPPPPKRRLSPWAVTGIGCLVLVVGAIVAVGVVAVQISNNIKAEAKKPINKEEILADLGETPLYPNIQFDEQVTRASRVGMMTFSRIIPAKKVVMAGFRTQDEPKKVYDWYSDKLLEKGYRPEKGRGGQRGGRAFRKESEMIMVQVEKQKGEWNGLMLMRFNGMRK